MNKIIQIAPVSNGDDADMAVPVALAYLPEVFDQPTVSLSITIGTETAGEFRAVNRILTLESFYELREAVNDLYDHIRQEQTTD